MVEENNNTSNNIDITKAAEDLANEKLSEKQKQEEKKRISELESKLQEYQKKEEEERKAEEERKKSEISKRLEELEKQRELDKQEYEQKLEKISTRRSSGKISDPKSVLSREEYDNNKDYYDQMLLKHTLENRKL